MKDLTIIFIGGMHGTGKGTICNQLCADERLVHLSSSELLRWSEYSPDPKNKSVRDITETQSRLIHGLSQLADTSKSYLLDGHYTLFDNDFNPTRVDVNVFKKIDPLGLVLLTEDSAIIKSRLEKRDGKEYPIGVINKMIELEKTHFIDVSAKLNVPSIKVNAENVSKARLFIEQLL